MVQHGIRFSGGWGGRCTHFTSPLSLHSDQNLHTHWRSAALTKLSVSTHTLTNSLLEWGGRGSMVAIYLRGYPLVICGMGEGGAYLDQVRMMHTFQNY